MMAIFKIKLVGISLLLLTHFTYSQNDWKSGYIITNELDTIQGLIDHRDSNSLTKACFFRSDEESETTSYAPEDLYGFHLSDGRLYVSKSVEIDGETNKLFLEYLLNGIASIYHIQLLRSHYFLEKDGTLYELKNSEVIRERNGKTFANYKKEYIGVLKALLQDSPEKLNVDGTLLLSKPLIKLAKEYHESVCDYECIIYKRSKKTGNLYLGVHAGSSWNSLNLGGTTYSDFSRGLTFGLKFGYQSFNFLENLGVYTGINFEKTFTYTFPAANSAEVRGITNSGAYIDYQEERYYFRNGTIRYGLVGELDELKADIDLEKLTIPVVFTYRLNNGSIKPYIGIGMINEFTLAQNDDFRYQYTYSSLGQTISNYAIGFIGIVGAQHEIGEKGMLVLEAGFSRSSNIDTNQFYKVSQSSIPLTLGYVIVL